MKNIINKLFSYNKKSIKLSEFIDLIKISDYEKLFDTIKQLEIENVLQSVKKSGLNGNIAKPLFNKYKIIYPKNVTDKILSEIKSLNPGLNIDGYLEKPEKYIKHKKIINGVSSYLWQKSDLLKNKMSKNERAFSIWNDEKFFDKNKGLINEILNFNNFSAEFFNYYKTYEPFFEYITEIEKNNNVLIVENKDTWFTIKKLFIECQKNVLFGVKINVLIYGEGNKITKKNALDEHFMSLKENNLIENVNYLYFGDLDYEGIGIYLRIANYNQNINFCLFTELYEKMLELSEYIDLPQAKNQRKLLSEDDKFYGQFSENIRSRIINILTNNRYIPQEILNYQVISKGLSE